MANILSTIIKKEMIDPIYKKSIIKYESNESIGSTTDSTSLIELNIIGQVTDFLNYRQYPYTILEGKCSIFKLLNIKVSCDSDDYNIKILNKNDITKINTINEIISIDNIDKSFNLILNPGCIIKNKDDNQTNKIYLQINNLSSINTGIIKIELIYEILKNINYSFGYIYLGDQQIVFNNDNLIYGTL